MNNLSSFFTNLTLILLISSFTSCKEDNIEFCDSPSNAIELFEIFWNKMNTNYVYWDIDTTDWDRIYYDYEPAFAKLDVKQPSDLNKAAQYFREMTSGLIDGHYNISFGNSQVSDNIISPAFERIKKRQEYHRYFYYNGIDKSYLDSGFQEGIVYGTHPLVALSGSIRENILFFSCTKFELCEAYYSENENEVQSVLQSFFDKLLNMSDSMKGIIIDLRGNQGGDLGDLNFFVGHFIDTQLHYGYTQTKSGNGRLEYTPWIKAYVNPGARGQKIDRPIIVLADLYTASLAEAVLMAFKTFSECVVIGETTWGATGPLVDTDVYNAGRFEIEGFLKVTTASCKFKYLNGNIYEGSGIPPDIAITFDEQSILRGRDIQIEKAISILYGD